MTALTEYLAYVEQCARLWIALGNREAAEEIRRVGYELMTAIGAETLLGPAKPVRDLDDPISQVFEFANQPD
jgi:hypothetical protein